jgi:hypothetical protein
MNDIPYFPAFSIDEWTSPDNGHSFVQFRTYVRRNVNGTWFRLKIEREYIITGYSVNVFLTTFLEQAYIALLFAPYTKEWGVDPLKASELDRLGYPVSRPENKAEQKHPDRISSSTIEERLKYLEHYLKLDQ